MTLRHPMLTFKPEGIETRVAYRRNAGPNPGTKEIAEMADAPYGATRELLSQMVKDGQVKNMGRGAYVLPENLRNGADNADILTTQESSVS